MVNVLEDSMKPRSSPAETISSSTATFVAKGDSQQAMQHHPDPELEFINRNSNPKPQPESYPSVANVDIPELDSSPIQMKIEASTSPVRDSTLPQVWDPSLSLPEVDADSRRRLQSQASKETDDRQETGSISTNHELEKRPRTFWRTRITLNLILLVVFLIVVFSIGLGAGFLIRFYSSRGSNTPVIPSAETGISDNATSFVITTTISSTEGSATAESSTAGSSTPPSNPLTTASTTYISTSSTPIPTNIQQVTLPNATYLGCFIDRESPHRLLSGENSRNLANPAMTNEMCEGICDGYAYFGTENGNECFCSDTLPAEAAAQRKAPENECRMFCAGRMNSKSESCGGFWRIGVFRRDS